MIKAVIINQDTRHVCHTLNEQSSTNPESYAKQYLRENFGQRADYVIEMIDTQGLNGMPEVFKRICNGHAPGSFLEFGPLSEKVDHY